MATVADEIRVVISSDTDVVLARQRGRQLAETMGFSSTEQTLIATAISEIARNIVFYADRGEVVLYEVDARGVPGIQVVARDVGPGIADIGQAMQDGYTTGQGMGLGLPGARRLMDDFEIESEVGRGTIVTMRKWRDA